MEVYVKKITSNLHHIPIIYFTHIAQRPMTYQIRLDHA